MRKIFLAIAVIALSFVFSSCKETDDDGMTRYPNGTGKDCVTEVPLLDFWYAEKVSWNEKQICVYLVSQQFPDEHGYMTIPFDEAEVASPRYYEEDKGLPLYSIVKGYAHIYPDDKSKDAESNIYFEVAGIEVYRDTDGGGIRAAFNMRLTTNEYFTFYSNSVSVTK